MSTPTFVITPSSRRSIASMLRELWSYRELVAIFVQREISIRYKQTAIGVAWAVLQPLLGATIFAVIFGIFAKFPSGGVPYLLFSFSGLITWQYISRGITEGATSFVSQASMLTKVYFPRIIFGLVPLCYGVLDFCLSFVALLVFCAILGYMPSVWIFTVPLVLLLCGLFAYGVGLILAPLNAMYRDVAIVVPFVIQILMYLSPIVYSQDIVPAKFWWVIDFNPVATLVMLMRWALFGHNMPSPIALGWLAVVITTLLYCGLKMVNRTEETIVDRL